ncbi:MAG: single-stranded-DNA-specific exonuclease RecJ [Clostridiales bacterium]|nr:single-stranded-DNA-specific exonuclease RecJ [Clostridiales bacterium]
MEKWFLANKKADFAAIGKKFGVSPVIAKIIRNRDIVDENDIHKFLYGAMDDLYDPMLMKDMDMLAAELKKSINSGKRIRVVQDYDVDGCMSGYILVTAIRLCGGNADYDVPDRTSEGYGINERIVKSAVNDGIGTLITCDNGIAAGDITSLAKSMGLCVLVTDHHEVQYVNADGKQKYLIPEADAVVDPKRPDCEYPFKHLCGAGIAYKVAEVLYDIYGRSKEELNKLLQYAAVATVCDIVDLTGENRIIVKEGFKVLEDTDNYGMRALLDRCLKPGEKISVGRVGFFIGPVINAGGRMSTAQLVMSLLFAKDREEAEDILDVLIELNEERKRETEDAVKNITSKYDGIPNGNVIIEYNPKCHESVAGIAAGRIKDLYYKPTIVLTDSEDEGYIKGSARSVEGFDIFERLLTVKDLLPRFGGHPMAAGMTLKKADLEEFIERMNKPGWPDSAEKFKRITIDVAMNFSSLSKEMIRELELIEPCGKGNKKPVFAAKNLKINRMSILGKNRNTIKMTLDDGTAEAEGIWFGDVDRVISEIIQKYGTAECERLLRGNGAEARTDIIYTPKINYYNGFERIQLDIESFRW